MYICVYIYIVLFLFFHCDLNQIEDKKHFLLLCPKYTTTRDTVMLSVRRKWKYHRKKIDVNFHDMSNL